MTTKKWKNRPQKLLIISPDHSPQPKIDFSCYEISGPDICSLICEQNRNKNIISLVYNIFSERKNLMGVLVLFAILESKNKFCRKNGWHLWCYMLLLLMQLMFSSNMGILGSGLKEERSIFLISATKDGFKGNDSLISWMLTPLGCFLCAKNDNTKERSLY